LRKQAELVEEGLRNYLVVEEGGRANFGRLVVFALGGDGGADLGEDSCEVVRSVDEGGAGVADGDANELAASLLFAEGCEEREILVGLLIVFLVAAKVPAKADLEEEEGAVFLVERVELGGEVVWYSTCVDNVGGDSSSCRNDVVEVFLWKSPSWDVPGGRHAFFVVHRCCPMCGEGLRVYGHVDPAIPSWMRGGGRCVIEPVGGEWNLLLLLLL
jgi:hypothetical protein